MSMVETLKRFALALPLALVALVLGVPAQDASAHTHGFYPWWWPVGIDNVPVRFDSEFPDGRSRSRITDGAKQWNNVGRRMYFRVDRHPSIASGGDTPTNRIQAKCPTPEVNGRRVGMMHWSTIDGRGGVGGTTRLCWKKGAAGSKGLHSFRIYFDRHEGWYTRTGDSNVLNRRTKQRKSFPDLWSAATHELGHATGWLGHWRQPGKYCDSSGPVGRFATMCPSYAPGLERFRTLSGADKHVFRAQYAPR